MKKAEEDTIVGLLSENILISSHDHLAQSPELTQCQPNHFLPSELEREVETRKAFDGLKEHLDKVRNMLLQ